MMPMSNSMANSSSVPSLSGIPSPPVFIPAAAQGSQYHPFQLASSQLIAQEPRYTSQPNYGYSLTQPQLAQPTFTVTQPSLFLQTAPASDVYQPSQLTGYRNQ